MLLSVFCKCNSSCITATLHLTHLTQKYAVFEAMMNVAQEMHFSEIDSNNYITPLKASLKHVVTPLLSAGSLVASPSPY